MQRTNMFMLLLLFILQGITAKNFLKNDEIDPVLATLYTRDRSSDKAVGKCLQEHYPDNPYHVPIRIDKTDIPCILLCVFKKFGIMDNAGHISVANYHRRVQSIHRYDPRVVISDVGRTCAQNIDAMNFNHDLCKKAKVFNDCTQLYAVSLTLK